MKLIRSEISNFGPFAEHQIVDFSKYDNTVCVITAKNKSHLGSNSNGSGKSYLMDAICWGIFDKFPRKVKADEVIRHGTNQCEVVNTIEHGGKIYRIANRRGKETRFYYTIDGGKEVEYRTKAHTVASLSEHMGISYDVFLNIVYLSQNSEKVLLSSDPKERINLISSLLNISKWATPLKRIKIKKKDIESKIASIDGILEGLDLQESDESIEVIKSSIEKIESENKFRVEHIEKLNIKINEQEAIQKSMQVVKEKEQELAVLDSNIKRIQSSIDESCDFLNRSVAEKEKSLELFKVKLVDYQKQSEIDYEELLKKIGDRDSIQERINNLTNGINGFVSEVSQIDSDINDKNESLGKIKGALSSLEAEKVELTNILSIDGQCPTCKTEITDKEKDSIREKISGIESDTDNGKTAQSGIETEISSLMNKRGDFNNFIKESTDKRQDAQREFDEYSKLSEEEFIAGVKSKKDEIEQDIKSTLESITEIKANYNVDDKQKDLEDEKQKQVVKFNELQAVKKEINFNDGLEEVNIDNLKSTARSIEAEINSANENKVRKETKIEQIKSSEENKKKYASEKEVLHKELEKVIFWEKGFGDYGIKKLVINQFLPEFESRSNEFLKKFEIPIRVLFTLESQKVSGKDGDYKDSFEIIVSDGEREGSWDSWSGGQKKRAIVSISQAWRSIVVDKLGIDIPFSIYDETVDSMDEQGLYFLFNVFKEIGGSHYVTSHNHTAEFRQTFDHNIHLEYSEDENGTKKTVVAKND